MKIKFFSMNEAFSKHKSILICVFLVLSALVAYWQVFSSDFVNYDDPVYVTDNEHVKSGLGRESIFWVFNP